MGEIFGYVYEFARDQLSNNEFAQAGALTAGFYAVLDYLKKVLVLSCLRCYLIWMVI
jgi:hypothetical protein